MKVSELTGAMLDYWVGQACGFGRACRITDHGRLEDEHCFFFTGVRDENDHLVHRSGDAWRPSTSWAQAGPIIAREGISISPPESPVHRHGGPHAGWGDRGLWSSTIFRRGPHRRTVAFHESDPLVAAMRAFVASRFGAEVTDEVTV